MPNSTEQGSTSGELPGEGTALPPLPEVATPAVVPAPPSAKVVAKRLLKWAHANSLLLPESFAPLEDLPVPNFQPPMSITSLGLLRSKQISFVGADDSSGEVVVFLHRAAPGERALKVMPRTVDGVRLRIRQGNPETIDPGHVSEATTTCALHISGGQTRYTCGSSVSVGNSRGAGTLGCLLIRNGVLMGLSNNHVTGSCSFAPIGMPILAPGVNDVAPANPAPFTIGFHALHLAMVPGDPSTIQAVDNLDAAIFRIADDSKVSSMQQSFYDTPTSVMDLKAGMTVEKVGRTTRHTSGKVIAEIIGPSGVTYSAPAYGFAGKVHFDPLFVVHGLSDRFSDAGDSGSLVVHKDASGVRHAVGIVVGGGVDTKAPGQKSTLILPLQPILQKLGAVLVSAHHI